MASTSTTPTPGGAPAPSPLDAVRARVTCARDPIPVAPPVEIDPADARATDHSRGALRADVTPGASCRESGGDGC